MALSEPVSAQNILSLSKQVLNRSDLKQARSLDSIEDALGFAPRKRRAELGRLIADLSPGMAIAPTYYKPPNKDAGPDSKTLRREYSKKVRPRANAYLAQNFERELRVQLGFDDTAIERMRNGLSPRDKDGRFFDFTWDHIIELGGSGALAAQRERDPKLADLPGWPPLGPTAPVNHMNNLFALGEAEHAHKNKIMGKMLGQRGSATVTLSYVREDADDGSPPFLPQPAARRQPLSPSQTIGHAEHCHDFLLGIMEMIAGRPAVKSALARANVPRGYKPSAQGVIGDVGKPASGKDLVLASVKGGPDGSADLTRIRLHYEETEQAWRDSIAAIARSDDNYQAKRLLTRMKRTIGELEAFAPLRFDAGPPLHERLQELYRDAERTLPPPMTRKEYQKRLEAPAGKSPPAAPSPV